MAKDVEKHEARCPRHPANAPPAVRVVIQRALGCVPESVGGELIDLSRTGVRFRSATRLAEAETITVRLEDPQGTPRLTCSAVVRWTRPHRADIWSIGCQLCEPLDLETLGELFLSDVLSAKPPPRPASKPSPPAPIDTGHDSSPFPPIERPLET